MNDIVERLRGWSISDCLDAADEIERLRDWQRQMVEMSAAGTLDGYREMASQLVDKDAEIERLRQENQTLRNAQKACADCDAPTVAEIERLRDTLRYLIANPRGYDVQRVREALGEKS